MAVINLTLIILNYQSRQPLWLNVKRCPKSCPHFAQKCFVIRSLFATENQKWAKTCKKFSFLLLYKRPVLFIENAEKKKKIGSKETTSKHVEEHQNGQKHRIILSDRNLWSQSRPTWRRVHLHLFCAKLQVNFCLKTFLYHRLQFYFHQKWLKADKIIFLWLNLTKNSCSLI